MAIKKRTQTDAKTAADAVIAAAVAKDAGRTPLPDAATVAELARIAEYNDGAVHKARVTIPDAIAFLRSRGWTGNCKQALDRLCVSALGRKSWGTK